jgi:hypothetical protein
MTITRHFCTYFDSNFYSRGLALYDSLVTHVGDINYYVLCLDQKCAEQLYALNAPNIYPIEVEKFCSDLQIDRTAYASPKEFFFSLTPKYIFYVLDKHPEVPLLTYLDADVYVFSSMDPYFEELGNASIGITNHNKSRHPFHKFFTHYGTYNVGVNSFRNDANGMKALTEWAWECENWKTIENYPFSFMSDQIFLDHWPEKHQNLVVFKNIGINILPGTLLGRKITQVGSDYHLDGHKVMIFHFSSMKRVSKHQWSSSLSLVLVRRNLALNNLYTTYIKALNKRDTPVMIAKLNISKGYLLNTFRKLMYRLLQDEITAPTEPEQVLTASRNIS